MKQPHPLTILHPLIPILLHPNILKVCVSPQLSTYPLASIVGMHAVNVFFWSAAEEVEGLGTIGESEFECFKDSEVPWETCGKVLQALHTRVYEWTEKSLASSKANYHSAFFLSNLIVLGRPLPSTSNKKPEVGGGSLMATSSSFPLTPLAIPPWYFSCPACNTPGHYIVDCPNVGKREKK